MDKQRDVLKIAARFHPGAHFLARTAVVQALRERFRSARLKFRRQHMDELRRAGGIGVNVAHHVKPFLPRSRDEREHLGHGAPCVSRADRLEMAHLQRRLQRAGDLDHLAQRVHHAVALLTHVHADGYAALIQRRKRADESVGRIEDLRRVAKAERYAARAVSKRLFHVIVHLSHFKRR